MTKEIKAERGQAGIMDIMAEITRRMAAAADARVLQEEKEIIRDFYERGKVKEKGTTATIGDVRAFMAAAEAKITRLLILNATTARTVKKALDEEGVNNVKMIITAAVETGTVYEVTDETLRAELLKNLYGKGY